MCFHLLCPPFFDYKCIYFVIEVQRKEIKLFSQRFTPVSAEFVHFFTLAFYESYICHICSYAAKNSSCVCILKTPPWKKERAAILCIKSEKVAAVSIYLKRHFGPDSDVLICTFAAGISFKRPSWTVACTQIHLGRDTVHPFF